MQTPRPGQQPPPLLLGPDLVALLQDMGLTWDEVRIYQFLLNASSAISSAIVQETGHSRGRIYEAMRQLVEKGFVREEPTRPIQFRPTPLAEILAGAKARLTRQLATVAQSQDLPLAIGDQDAAVPLLAPTKPRDVRVLSGRRACHAEIARMLAEAGRFFWLTGGEHLVARLAAMPPLLRAMKSAHDKGLDVQLVLPRSNVTRAALADMTSVLGPDIIQAAAVDQFGPLVSCATDLASMEVISQPNDAALHKGDDVAIQVSSELYAEAARRRAELADAFHRSQAALPYQWLGPNHGSDLFLQAVQRAQRDVCVIGPAQWSAYMARDWQRNAATYRDAKGRGVEFRALTVRGNDSLEAFAHVWDIQVIPEHPVWLTIVDGCELYQAFTHPSLAGPPQFRQSREPNEIRFYEAVFARLWAGGQPA